MPSASAIHAGLERLASKIPVGPTIVCVGGTSGIGEAMARRMAELSQQPKIHIVGRNESAAESILADLKQINPSGSYHFERCDLTLVSEIKQLNEKLAQAVDKIHYLILSPGILTMAGRTETAEGNDRKLMLHYYARMGIINGLAGKLEAGARVTSILDSHRGNPAKLNMDDLDLKSHYSLGAAATHAISMNDASLQHLSTLRPNVKFIHSYPGIVKTPLFHDLPWYARAGASAISAVAGVSPEQSAEAMLYPMLLDDDALKAYEVKGAHFSSNTGEPVTGKKIATADQRLKIWEHTLEILS